jgi:DmsE family decaheme c-type cytochrome
VNRTTRTGPGPAAVGTVGPLLAIALVIAAVGPAAAGFAIELPEALRDAAYVGDSECLDCHDGNPAEHYRGFHADVRDFQVVGSGPLGCESCHGPASKHVESEDPDLIVNPLTADPELANGLCVRCHRTGALDGYRASLHGMSDVRCVSCHGVHGAQSTTLLREAEVDLCTSCHEETKLATWLPPRHPLREGRMVCTDCHDPHSDGWATSLPGDRTVDLCFECHANKQGPFVFEHDPVIEDCTICHDPHGSVANSLLKQNEPFLCLQCHQPHFHATLEGYEGEFTTLDGYSGVSDAHATKATFLTKCTQCHTEIHGSDLPSQSISGQGRALTR